MDQTDLDELVVNRRGERQSAEYDLDGFRRVCSPDRGCDGIAADIIVGVVDLVVTRLDFDLTKGGRQGYLF